MSRADRTLKDIHFYSLATIIAQVITVLASILTRRFLGPTQMGVWVFLQVLLNYTEFSALGTTMAASLEIPLHNGKRDLEQSRRITNAAFSFAVISSLAVSCLVIAYAVWRRQALGEVLFYGFLMAAAFVVLQRFNSLAITLVRADKQFTLAGKQMLYSSIINVVLIALFSYRFRLYGFLAAMALSLIFNIAYLSYRSGLRVRFTLDWAQMGSLIRYGFPLITLGFAVTVFDTMDPLFIKHFIGFEVLGLYSVALMTLNYLTAVPNSVGVVTIPHLQEKYGETGNSAELRGYLKKVDAGYSALMIFLIGGAWILVPWLIRMVLPKYVDGIPALQALSLSSFFMAMAQAGYAPFLYVIRKHNSLLLLTTISCLVAAGSNAVALYLGYGLLGIAVATVFSSFFYYSLLFFYSSSHVERFNEAARRYLKIAGAFILMLVALFGIARVNLFHSLYIDPWLQMIIYSIFAAPFLWSSRSAFGISERWPFKRKGADAAA